MKLIDVINARRVIINKASVKGISFGTSFKFMKFMKATDDDQKFYEEKRNELIEKFATKDENGTPIYEGDRYSFTDENFKEVNKQLVELAGTEVEISESLKFTEQELDKMEFTIEEVSAIYDLIKE